MTHPDDGLLPPSQNSIGVIVFNTARVMSGRAEVALCTQAGTGERPELCPGELVVVEPTVEDALLAFAARHPRWATQFGLSRQLARRRGWARAVRRRLSQRPVDILHVMNYWDWCDILWSDRRQLVLEMQSEWLSQMPKRLVEAKLRHVNAVVAVSSHVKELFSEAIPEYRGRVEIVPNGVDTDVFHPSPSERGRRDRNRLLFVGRVSPEKGIHVLIDAVHRASAKLPLITLDIVGSRTQLAHELLVGLSRDPMVRELDRFYRLGGENYQHCIDKSIADRGLGDRVRFHGALPHAQIVQLYQQADLVVNPSLSETFGISVVEGMACAVPVVGSRVGGMKDTIVPEVGTLVRPDDPQALADAIISILENAGRASEMGAQGRARALERFTWQARGKKLAALYEELCV